MNELVASFIGHLEELRTRLLKSVLAIAVCSFAVYQFKEKILAVLAKPAGKLVFLSPTEAFVVYIKLAMWGGLFIASPIIIYQLWRFLSAGLKANEKKYVYCFMPVSFLLFAAGASFGFYVIIVYGMKFLLSFSTDFMAPMISVGRYVSFISSMLLAFGIVFQLPLVMFFLAKIRLVTPAFFSAKRKYAVVSIFITAGILTPGPDIFSQFAMAVPLLILYEAGILMARIAYRQPQVVVKCPDFGNSVSANEGA